VLCRDSEYVRSGMELDGYRYLVTHRRDASGFRDFGYEDTRDINTRKSTLAFYSPVVIEYFIISYISNKSVRS
jgi:hypothetical protein